MLGTRQAQRIVMNLQDFQEMFFVYVSLFLQSHVQNVQRGSEHERENMPQIRAMYWLCGGAEPPCAGITLRVQAYSACSTSHYSPAVQRPCSTSYDS